MFPASHPDRSISLAAAGPSLEALPSFTGEAFDRDRLAQAAGRVQAHPRFDEALQVFCGAVIAGFEDNRAAGILMGDAARFALMALVFVLDHQRRTGEEPAGATSGRLAELLARRKLASPNFTHAAVEYLRAAGALVPVASTDRRTRPLAPGPGLIAQARHWLAGNLKGIAMLAELPPAAELVQRPGFLDSYFRRMAWPYLTQNYILFDGFAPVQALMQRRGGYAILLELTRGARVDADGRIVVTTPMQAMAQRIGISRSQVRSVLSMAEAAGWLTREGRGDRRLALSADFHATCRDWVAVELAWGFDLARAASLASAAPAHEEAAGDGSGLAP